MHIDLLLLEGWYDHCITDQGTLIRFPTIIVEHVGHRYAMPALPPLSTAADDVLLTDAMSHFCKGSC